MMYIGSMTLENNTWLGIRNFKNGIFYTCYVI